MAQLIKLYTDGAIHKGAIGWGFIAIGNNGKTRNVLAMAHGMIDPNKPKELLAQRNVAGEMKAVLEALRWAETTGIKDVIVVHDYKGCSMWPLGKWRAKNKYTQLYANRVKKFMRDIGVGFEWVKGHSGNIFNELADTLAKHGAKHGS